MAVFNLETGNTQFKPFIVAAVVGGSSVYSEVIRATSDLDCLLMVRTRAHLLKLARDLPLLLSICLVKPHPNHAAMMSDALSRGLPFDAIRLAGTNTAGRKKSVKVLSAECLATDFAAPQTILILSLKDKRAYTGPRSSLERWGLFPSTSFETKDGVAYFLFEDQDVITTTTYPGFGIIADLLTSGSVIVGDQRLVPIFDPSNRHADSYVVALKVLLKLLRLQPGACKLPDDLCMLWQRWPRFSPAFAQSIKSWARSTLDDLVAMQGSHGESQAQPRRGYQHIDRGYKNTFPYERPDHQLILEHLSHLPGAQVLDSDTQVLSTFCSTSVAGKSSLWGEQVFWKRNPAGHDEIEGLRLLLGTPYAMRNRFQVPLAYDPSAGVIFYPRLDLVPVAQLRLHEISSWLAEEGFAGPPATLSTAPHRLASIVVNVAFQRAEDMWRTYAATVAYSIPGSSASPPIDRFFAHRLELDGLQRLRELHPAGITMRGCSHRLSVSNAFERLLTVNGRSYPSLGTLLGTARQRFEGLSKRPHMTALGHGDLHLGNILVAGPQQKGGDDSSVGRTVTIDYDTFGYHSPWIDFAKPLYNDSFWPYFYADMFDVDLRDAGIIQIAESEDKQTIVLDFTPYGQATAHADIVGKALMRILADHVVKPLTRITPLAELNDSLKLLAAALLCCGVLTRDFAHRGDVFWTNVAICVLLGEGLMEHGVEGLTGPTFFPRVSQLDD